MTINDMKKTLKKYIVDYESEIKISQHLAVKNIEDALKALRGDLPQFDAYVAIVNLRNELKDAAKDINRYNLKCQVFGDTLAELEKITEKEEQHEY